MRSLVIARLEQAPSSLMTVSPKGNDRSNYLENYGTERKLSLPVNITEMNLPGKKYSNSSYMFALKSKDQIANNVFRYTF